MLVQVVATRIQVVATKPENIYHKIGFTQKHHGYLGRESGTLRTMWLAT